MIAFLFPGMHNLALQKGLYTYSAVLQISEKNVSSKGKISNFQRKNSHKQEDRVRINLDTELELETLQNLNTFS